MTNIAKAPNGCSLVEEGIGTTFRKNMKNGFIVVVDFIDVLLSNSEQRREKQKILDKTISIQEKICGECGMCISGTKVLRRGTRTLGVITPGESTALYNNAY